MTTSTLRRTILNLKEQQAVVDLLRNNLVETGGYWLYTGGHTDYSIATLSGTRANHDHVRRLRVTLYGPAEPPRKWKRKEALTEQEAKDADDVMHKLVAATVKLSNHVIDLNEKINTSLTVTGLMGVHLGIAALDETTILTAENTRLGRIEALLEKILEVWGYGPKAHLEEALNEAHKSNHRK